MREILFRGFNKCETGKDKIFLNGEWIQGEWVEGSLLIDPDLEYYNIIGFNYYSSENGLEREEFTEDVILETVGQYTGLKDKNGKKIFEGDIVKEYNSSGEYKGIGNVQWVELFLAWHAAMYGYYISSYEVIGNIHSNPELLEVNK